MENFGNVLLGPAFARYSLADTRNLIKVNKNAMESEKRRKSSRNRIIKNGACVLLEKPQKFTYVSRKWNSLKI